MDLVTWFEERVQEGEMLLLTLRFFVMGVAIVELKMLAAVLLRFQRISRDLGDLLQVWLWVGCWKAIVLLCGCGQDVGRSY